MERAIGMSKGYLARLAAPEGYGDVSAHWLSALAKELGVSLDWLASGEEHTGATVVEYDERYPNRAQAVAAARALGFSSEAIARVQTVVLSRTDDPSPREWLRKIEAIEDDVRSEQAAPPLPDPAVQDELERATKPKLPKLPKRSKK